jgi:hypothetical protein
VPWGNGIRRDKGQGIRDRDRDRGMRVENFVSDELVSW